MPERRRKSAKKARESLVIRVGKIRIEITHRQPRRRVVGPPPTDAPAVSATATHADDFSSVNWFGTPYTFTVNQRGPVRLLWEAWERGGNGVCAAALVEASESDDDQCRPAKLFQRSPAWGAMIVRVAGTRDVYQLNQSSSG